MVHSVDLKKSASTRAQSRVPVCFLERHRLAVVAWNGVRSARLHFQGGMRFASGQKARKKPENYEGHQTYCQTDGGGLRYCLLPFSECPRTTHPLVGANPRKESRSNGKR